MERVSVNSIKSWHSDDLVILLEVQINTLKQVCRVIDLKKICLNI